MALQVLSPLLSDAEFEARNFYDRWIGGTGFASPIGRLVFGLSGIVYSRTFARVARLTSGDRVIEIGCGMGAILAAAQRRVRSEESYLGIDLSLSNDSSRQGKSVKRFGNEPSGPDGGKRSVTARQVLPV